MKNNKSIRVKWKRLEKDNILWSKKRGVFMLVYRRVGGVASGGAVVRAGGGMVAKAGEGVAKGIL